MPIARKYRGPLRIVPIRETVLRAIRENDTEALREAVKMAKLGGFPKLAEQAREHLNRILFSEEEIFRIQMLPRFSPRRRWTLRQPRNQEHYLERHNGVRDWPWVKIQGKPTRYRLQRSWAHLAGKLPDWNQHRTWTDKTSELHHQIVQEESARRKRAA